MMTGRPGLNRSEKLTPIEMSKITPAITVSAAEVLEWPRPRTASTGEAVSPSAGRSNHARR
jgi:hypothetical protein